MRPQDVVVGTVVHRVVPPPVHTMLGSVHRSLHSAVHRSLSASSALPARRRAPGRALDRVPGARGPAHPSGTASLPATSHLVVPATSPSEPAVPTRHAPARRHRWGAAWLGVSLLAAACADTPSPEVADDPDRDTAPATSHAAPPPDPGPCRPALDPDEPAGLTGGGTTAAPTGGPEDAALWADDVREVVDDRFTERTAGVWLDPDTLEVVVQLTAPDPDGDEVAAMPDEDVLAELAEAAGDPDAVVCQRARASTAELAQLADDAFDRLQPATMSGGPDELAGVVRIDYEGDLEEALDRLGELADHPALLLEVPECARWDPADAPTDAIALPGDGSNCGGMLMGVEGTLAGDPETGCLWLEVEPFEGGEAFEPAILLWPAGWTVTPDGTVHDQHGQPVAAIGDAVRSAGGHVGPTVVEPCGDDERDAILVHGVRRAG
ncbi:hypothetical protein FTX61_01275 [Nitriliruptoraceae bacterium ZYF776]|nr:hypothetical protein [Profundirhabdus halotolerans]